jgi:hypothetical protein
MPSAITWAMDSCPGVQPFIWARRSNTSTILKFGLTRDRAVNLLLPVFFRFKDLLPDCLKPV